MPADDVSVVLYVMLPELFLISNLNSRSLIGRRAAGRDSQAYFHLPNTKTALRPPCSSLIIHIQARAS